MQRKFQERNKNYGMASHSLFL